MANETPDWLAQAIAGDPAPLGKLMAARVADGKLLNKGGLSLKSAAFADGGELDPCFTAAEDDAVAPPLEWTGPGPLAQELVLVAECPDVDGEAACHWLVWGLPGQKGQLLEGEVPPRVGKNAQRNSEWLLPDVALGSDPKRFVFQLFATDLPLTLMPGATRDEVEKALAGSVISCALLTGTFAGAEEIEWDFSDESEG